MRVGKIVIKCKVCEKDFFVFNCQIKKGRKFCSYNCYWKELSGKSPKIDNTGKVSWNKGKKFDGGIGYGNWQGGKTDALVKARKGKG